MSETLTVTTERVDDIPLLLAQLEKMGLATLLDQHFPPHGNWQGLSLGCVASLWLTHILSQADHRLNPVQAWAAARLRTLQATTHQPVRSLDLTDDRLAALLLALSADLTWADFETALTRRLVRVYDLRPARVRLDSTSASGYWQVTPDGLFQLGHSKDHRPDLPQLKLMLATLDPLGLPITTDVLGGQSADDPAYLPSIERVRATLGVRGLLYVGDGKMAALLTRAHVAHGRDRYLCPLSAVQVPVEHLRALRAECEAAGAPLREVVRPTASGELRLIAEGYEQRVALDAEVAGERVAWVERRLLVHSWAAAHAAEAALHARLQRAQAAVQRLAERRRGKARLASLAALQAAATAVLAAHRVEGLLRVACTETVQRRQMRGYCGAPDRQVEERAWQVEVSVEEAAVRAGLRAGLAGVRDECAGGGIEFGGRGAGLPGGISG